MPVQARIDRLPLLPMHRKAVLLVGAGLLFDAYETFLAGTVSQVLQDEFLLSGSALELVLASAFIGQVIGSVAMGRFADRFGRKKSFVVNLLMYSVFTLAGAFAVDPTTMAIFRFLAGLGIGAEFTLADSYLSELLPAAHRGRQIAWAYTVSFLGIPLVGFLALWLVPLHPLGVAGWRWLFVIGALGSGLTWSIRRALPESPRWLASKGRTEEADGIVGAMERQATGPLLPTQAVTAPAPVRAGTSPLRRRTVMAWVLSGTQAVGYYGFGTLAPLVLTAKGFPLIHSLAYTAVSYLGYPLGSLLSVPVVERFERKYLIMVLAGLMAACGLGFGLGSTGPAIVVCGFAYTLVSNLFSNTYHIYLAEQYPTHLRGAAVGAAYAVGKSVTAALPFLLLPLLHAQGAGPMFATIAAVMLLLIVNVATLGPRTTGRAIDIFQTDGQELS
ncbi:MFS transporter [Streptomyces violens]|uniref:MFS transporter n=1 Tax=Streptomyces violens TaxID=66377 RepID=UPI0004C26689|nr:MFS transporter [Streptomyces violens]